MQGKDQAFGKVPVSGEEKKAPWLVFSYLSLGEFCPLRTESRQSPQKSQLSFIRCQTVSSFSKVSGYKTEF